MSPHNIHEEPKNEHKLCPNFHPTSVIPQRVPCFLFTFVFCNKKLGVLDFILEKKMACAISA